MVFTEQTGHNKDTETWVRLCLPCRLGPANVVQACSVRTTSSCSEQLVQAILVMYLVQVG